MVVISTKEPTCRTAAGESTIDFYMVDTVLAQTAGAITLMDVHALKTHKPVVLKLTEWPWNSR